MFVTWEHCEYIQRYIVNDYGTVSYNNFNEIKLNQVYSYTSMTSYLCKHLRVNDDLWSHCGFKLNQLQQHFNSFGFCAHQVRYISCSPRWFKLHVYAAVLTDIYIKQSSCYYFVQGFHTFCFAQHKMRSVALLWIFVLPKNFSIFISDKIK